MDNERLKKIFPKGSRSFFDANRSASSSDTKSGLRSRTLAKSETEKADTRKRKVSITSYRVRPCDVDALCGKWHLDALRMFGVIKDDTCKDIIYQISQKKTDTKEQEKTLIQIDIL